MNAARTGGRPVGRSGPGVFKLEMNDRNVPFATATIVERKALFYADGADATLDRPRHVRAGSGLRLVAPVDGPRLVVAQDDTNFLALVDPATFAVSAVPLPSGPNGERQFGAARRNKKHKLDLESLEEFVDDDGRPFVAAFGSGARAPPPAGSRSAR